MDQNQASTEKDQMVPITDAIRGLAGSAYESFDDANFRLWKWAGSLELVSKEDIKFVNQRIYAGVQQWKEIKRILGEQ